VGTRLLKQIETMTITTFDTLKFARRLKDAGVSEAQAEAIKEVFAEALDTQVATKSDMQNHCCPVNI